MTVQIKNSNGKVLWEGETLVGANLIVGRMRSDGYQFMLFNNNGELRVVAGCRNFSTPEARKYWQETRGEIELRLESRALIDHLEAMARIRKWIT